LFVSHFFFKDTATTEIYPLSLPTLFRSEDNLLLLTKVLGSIPSWAP